MRSARTMLAVLALVLFVTACGDDDGDGPPPPDTRPLNTGATCEDETGDLSTEARALGGDLTEPAGIDLTRAESEVTESTLKVTFETVGPIATAPEPEFILAQGLPDEDNAFELRARPVGAADGPWQLRLIRFQRGPGGNVVQAPDVILNTPVRVEDRTLSYEVAQTQIPRISSYVWQFGTTSGETDAIIDVCAQDDVNGSIGTTTTTA
jgi:hypothetical protein